MLSFIGNGSTLFTFEDLTRTGESDQDFTDIAFVIDAELETRSTPEPTMTLAWLIAGTIGGNWLRKRQQG